jgi:hypothetical protein
VRALRGLRGMLLIPVVSIACGDSIAADGAVVPVYGETFSEGPGGWHTYLTDLHPDSIPPQAFGCWLSWNARYACMAQLFWNDDRAASRSPWWVDPNHAPPGAGYLQLVAFVYLNGYFGGLPDAALDLSATRLRARVRVDSLATNGGHLHFWFQAVGPGPGTYVNYVLTRFPLEQAVAWGEWAILDIPLDPTSDAWTCLGAADEYAERYKCVPVSTPSAQWTSTLVSSSSQLISMHPPRESSTLTGYRSRASASEYLYFFSYG